MRLNALVMSRNTSAVKVLAAAFAELEMEYHISFSPSETMDLVAEGKYSALVVDFDLPHAVEVATWREAREQHAREITRICDQVEADFRQRHCPDGGLSVGGRWAINHEIMRRVIELWPDMRFVCQLHTTR